MLSSKPIMARKSPGLGAALPGLGPYTAAAVGSLAFGIPALSVDGNVGRILCRIAGIEDDPRRAPVRRRLESLVADAMQVHPPGELNQAIMEIGARVCRPRLPRCDECPCARYCEAHALGIEELIPPSNLFFLDSLLPDEKKFLIDSGDVNDLMIRNRMQNTSISEDERDMLEGYI